jgi:hypothetical protein
MSKHTPGPWEFSHTWVQTVDKKTPIANFNFYASTEANARLIAAAPELLEALRNIISDIEPTDPNDRLWVGARAAIAKATGEQA